MKKNKLTKPIVLLLLLSSTTTTFAASTSTNTTTIKCTDVIRACDSALAAKDAAIKARDTEIQNYEVMTKAQADELASKDRQLSAWYRSPWLYLGLGLVGGLYLGRK